MRTLRTHGMTDVPYRHTSVSQNFRMSELEAAWLLLALDEVDTDVARRRSIAEHIRQRAGALRWQAAHADHAYHLLVLRSAARDELRAQLAARGVGTAVHYPLAVHQQPAYAHLTSDVLPVSSAWAARVRERAVLPGDDRRRGRARRVGARRRGRRGIHTMTTSARSDVCSVSAIFPCYNDEPTIAGLIDDVHAALVPARRATSR